MCDLASRMQCISLLLDLVIRNQKNININILEDYTNTFILHCQKQLHIAQKEQNQQFFFFKYQISQTAETLNSKNMTGKLKKNSNIKKKEVLMNTCTNHLNLYTLGENKIRKRRQRHARTSQTRRTLCISTRERQLKKIAPGYERKVPQE